MYIQIAAVIGSLLIGLATGYKVTSWKYESEKLAEVEAQKEAITAIAQEVAKLDIQHKVIYQKVQTHVIEKPVYHECKHADDGMRLINEALSGKPGSDSELPKPDTTD
jgi:hypothetical protein